MYESAKLVVSEYGKLVARILQYIACLTHVQIYNKSSHVALCFAVFHKSLLTIFGVKSSIILRKLGPNFFLL
jgi:hypothetical protein